MKKCVFRKALILAIIVCFVGTSIAPSLGGVSVKKPVSTENGASIKNFGSRGNTLYVGGGGPGNYSSIQSAINDANNGDTIFVYDDSSPYYENLVVYKSISLIGENKYTTVIDGGFNGYGLNIYYDDVIVEKFSVRNAWVHSFHIVESSNVIIRDNIIFNTSGPVGSGGIGVTIGYITENVTICDNIIFDNDHYGILIGGGTLYNLVSNNSIYNNQVHGIHFDDASYNIIRNNEGVRLHY